MFHFNKNKPTIISKLTSNEHLEIETFNIHFLSACKTQQNNLRFLMTVRDDTKREKTVTPYIIFVIV